MSERRTATQWREWMSDFIHKRHGKWPVEANALIADLAACEAELTALRARLAALAKDWAADKDGMMSYAYAARELRAALQAPVADLRERVWNEVHEATVHHFNRVQCDDLTDRILAEIAKGGTPRPIEPESAGEGGKQ